MNYREVMEGQINALVDIQKSLRLEYTTEQQRFMEITEEIRKIMETMQHLPQLGDELI